MPGMEKIDEEVLFPEGEPLGGKTVQGGKQGSSEIFFMLLRHNFSSLKSYGGFFRYHSSK